MQFAGYSCQGTYNTDANIIADILQKYSNYRYSLLQTLFESCDWLNHRYNICSMAVPLSYLASCLHTRHRLLYVCTHVYVFSLAPCAHSLVSGKVLPLYCVEGYLRLPFNPFCLHLLFFKLARLNVPLLLYPRQTSLFSPQTFIASLQPFLPCLLHMPALAHCLSTPPCLPECMMYA